MLEFWYLDGHLAKPHFILMHVKSLVFLFFHLAHVHFTISVTSFWRTFTRNNVYWVPEVQSLHNTTWIYFSRVFDFFLNARFFKVQRLFGSLQWVWVCEWIMGFLLHFGTVTKVKFWMMIPTHLSSVGKGCITLLNIRFFVFDTVKYGLYWRTKMDSLEFRCLVKFW